jgi:hypothetical protein
MVEFETPVSAVPVALRTTAEYILEIVIRHCNGGCILCQGKAGGFKRRLVSGGIKTSTGSLFKFKCKAGMSLAVFKRKSFTGVGSQTLMRPFVAVKTSPLYARAVTVKAVPASFISAVSV